MSMRRSVLTNLELRHTVLSHKAKTLLERNSLRYTQMQLNPLSRIREGKNSRQAITETKLLNLLI